VTTTRDLIADSFKVVGVLADGEVPSATQLTDGFNSLKRMLASWSTEELLVFFETREVFPLVGGQSSYTLGPTGNFNTVRPIKIERAGLVLTNVTPNVEVPITILNQDQRADIVVKDITSSMPSTIYSQGTFPLDTIIFYPVPSVAHSVALYSQKPLTQIATLNDVVSLPEGYEEAIIYNLAFRHCPAYGKTMSAEALQIMTESKENIKRTNIRPAYLSVDDSLLDRGSRFNIYTGE
jgi:hypothetical protein